MMMTNQLEITKPQAKALANLLHELRPDWDPQGLLTAIHTARTKSGNFDLAIAAIRAAATPSVRTPAVIGMDGPHWHPYQTAPATPRQHVQATGRCSKPDCGGIHAPDAPCYPPESQRTPGRSLRAALRQVQAREAGHE